MAASKRDEARGRRPRPAMRVTTGTLGLIGKQAMLLFGSVCLLTVACSKTPHPSATGTTTSAAKPPEPPKPLPKRVWPPDPDRLPAVDGAKPDPASVALQVVEGKDHDKPRDQDHGDERFVDRKRATEQGLAIVDLSDDWAPFVFADATSDDGKPLVNRYREIFVGLANDRTDGDGQPLRHGEHNFLEPYGIPPSFSVLRRRFITDGAATCFASIDREKLLAVDQIATFGSASEKKERDLERARAEKLEARRQEKGLATLADLATDEPGLKRDFTAHQRAEAERAAFAEAEKRLVCDGLLDPARHAAGRYDTPMRFAMLAFQQKNLVMAQGEISRGTLEALARPPLESDFLAFRRTLAERVADAGGFLEDGSVTGVAEVPDLVGQGVAAVLARLAIETPDDALAFFRRRASKDFHRFAVAARLPSPPPYYSDAMDLRAEIDRGDVWYDFPFDSKGRRLPQPRRRYPGFSLIVKYEGRDIPIVRWRTTIGGWRSELASDGQEYLRYKDSDVGPRVWRNIVAAPVWVPPPSTPMSGFVKEKWVNGAIIKVPNHDEVGPGYLSAYGLVAGIHVEPHKQGTGSSTHFTYFDNGIRTHGTFDYTSLRGRFSHGCHRLENHLAVRLFSFVLRHRHKKALGSQALDYRRQFLSGGETFDLRLPSRGFYYELVPPLPVETLLGTIKGTRTTPMAGYVRKPGVVYAKHTPPPAGADDKAGGAAPADSGQ